jgi:hypothetical protein
VNKFLVSVSLVALLSACGTTQDHYEKRATAERERLEKQAENAVDQAPDWMIDVPISNNAVFETGTGISLDWSMSDIKAKADAYGKICMAAGGTVNQRTKIYRADSEKTSTEFSEMAMRTGCNEVDLTGVEVKKIKHIAEGGRIRTYVLVALPTGDANLLKKAKDAHAERMVMAGQKDAAFRELDTQVETAKPKKVIAFPKSQVQPKSDEPPAPEAAPRVEINIEQP